jgi:hypothetical protein
MAPTSRLNNLTLFTKSPKLIGSQEHVTADGQKNPKLSRHLSFRTLYSCADLKNAWGYASILPYAFMA